MAQRIQTLTLRRQAKVNWLPPAATKPVPAVVMRIEESNDDYTDVLIELERAGGGYVKGDQVEVSAKRLSPRGRT